MESKSDDGKSPEEQELQNSTRISRLGRKRKKKVCADYYYGEEFFKPNNGAKKKSAEKQKVGKVRGKYKTQTKVNSEEARKVIHKSEIKFNFVSIVFALRLLLFPFII